MRCAAAIKKFKLIQSVQTNQVTKLVAYRVCVASECRGSRVLMCALLSPPPHLFLPEHFVSKRGINDECI